MIQLLPSNSFTLPFVQERFEYRRLTRLLVFFSLDFGNEAKDVEVKVGSEICAVTLVTDAEITCTVERFAVGANLVTMHVTGKGTFVFCKCTNSAFGANRKVVIKLVCL